MHRKLCTLAVAASLTACVGTTTFDPFAEIVVDEAHLEDIEMWQAAVGFGIVDGRADLEIIDVQGDEHSIDVTLRGAVVGLVADGSVAIAVGDVPLVLPGERDARDLLGPYDGASVGVDVGVGGHYRDLTNDSGVRMQLASFSVGVGAQPLAWESLDIQARDDPQEEVSVCDERVVEDGDCDFSCGDDPDCEGVCVDGDGVCDFDCPDGFLFGGETDSDCAPACGDDGFCDADQCGDDDPDCPQPPPPACDPSRYDDGVCDEGCDYVDPDCPTRRTPPAEWTCDAEEYDDGSCEDASTCGVDDVADCAPSEWTCERDRYDDGVCDCDCGALDDDCFGAC